MIKVVIKTGPGRGGVEQLGQKEINPKLVTRSPDEIQAVGRRTKERETEMINADNNC